MDYLGFLDACKSIASSVGEFALLLLAGALSYLAVVLRSVVRKMDPQNLTSSQSGSGPVRRASRARREPRSSSARQGVSAATFPPSPQESNDHGLSQVQPPPLSQVERFVLSIEESELGKASVDLRRRPDGTNSDRRPEPDAGRGSDHGRSDDASVGSASGGVLAVKRTEIAG